MKKYIPGFLVFILLCHFKFINAQDTTRYFLTDSTVIKLKEVTVKAQKDNDFGITRLKQVEGTSIYAGKKNEVIVMSEVNGNTATNNARQVYSKIAGLNIWESDGAGIQLGIGGRGLSPNRVSNFNTRQNGYDISADALGYPESYYTPPTEALERIEVVRGAASLQYGTQFGGFINFKLKQGSETKKLETLIRQTNGSFGFSNTFVSFGGTVKKLNYYTFYQYKKGDGWRPNSEFDVHTVFGGFNFQLNTKLKLGVEYTHMNYLAKQAGGLTDKQFMEDPRQSNRDRNWFRVNWNLGAIVADYEINMSSKINWRTFGLYAQRDALGNLNRIDRPDGAADRNYLQDKFRNYGSEFRYLKRYELFKNQSVFLIGARYYKGRTLRKQGLGNNGKGADFYYLNPDNLEHSDYVFPSSNVSMFTENIFRFSTKFSITPGLRWEYIKTQSEGYYHEESKDLAGNILYQNNVQDNRENNRSFLLAGAGLSYRINDHCEVYSNISQNYRSINFSDMRIVNPNARVDPNLQDESGYSADVGYRGNIQDLLNFDISFFYLKYNKRIGSIQKADPLNYQIYRLRTNISDSRNQGIEAFAELNLLQLLKRKERKTILSVFANYSIIDAKYLNSKEISIREGNKVELVPENIIRTGINFTYKEFKFTWQYAYTSEQYTEATNAIISSNSVDGLIPSYYITDIFINYTYKWTGVSFGVNNLTDNMYFTRRAEGYPGPGIIPSDGRSFFITLQGKF